MAAFILSSPSGKKEYEGDLNLHEVTEELLNGFFCHYEPPTSDNAQFKAARAARADPTKYSDRPVAKPILRTPTLHPKHRKKGATAGTATTAGKSSHRSDTDDAKAIREAPSGGGGSSGKSVTWRDEQTNNERNVVEKEVVGCAINYCGIFQHGEGLTDVLISPDDDDIVAAAEIGASKTKRVSSSRKKRSVGGSNLAGTPTSNTSNGSSGRNGSKKRLTPILMNRNKKNEQDIPSPAPATTLANGKRILYDDLGNPFTEDETLDTATTIGPTRPGNGTATVPPPPNDDKVGATTMDTNNPLAFLFSVPTVVIGAATIAAASAAEAVGYKLVPLDAPAAIAQTPEATALPSILRKPEPADTNTGIIMAEGRDETDVYEPVDYNNPFPNITRDPKRGPAYKRVRSPPIRRRQSTPRQARGMSARYEEELSEVECSTPEEVNSVKISSLGKLPRQSTSTARRSPQQSPAMDQRQDLTPSTITEATSYHFEKDTSGRRLGPAKSPGGRSDIYSDLTMEEEAHIYYQSPTKQERAVNGDWEFEYRRTCDEMVEEQTRLYHDQQIESRSDQRSGGAEAVYRPRILYGMIGEEEPLSPRHYADQYSRQRWKGYCDPDKNNVPRETEKGVRLEKEKKEVEVTEDEDNEADENLSPRQYAEKYRQLRAAQNADAKNEVASRGGSRGKESTIKESQYTEKVDFRSLERSREYRKAKISIPKVFQSAGVVDASRQEASKGNSKRKENIPVESQSAEKVEASSQDASRGSSKRKDSKPQASQERPHPADPDSHIPPRAKVNDRQDVAPRYSMDPVKADSMSKMNDRQDPTPRYSVDPVEADQVKVTDRNDPTPRYSVDPVEADNTKRREQLPATPRMDGDASQERSKRSQEKPRKPVPSILESYSAFDFSQKSFDKLLKKTLDQLSPKSMATDDEIREEASSGGMVSETIRPLYYECPFMNVPVTEEQEQNLPMELIPLKEIDDLEPSTLSGSESTLSSRPTETTIGSSQKKNAGGGDKGHRAIQHTYSGSTRSKKLWRGWKKTMGKVRKIVHDIDEQRIHTPQFSHAINAHGLRKAK
jgi:hypothetical protein